MADTETRLRELENNFTAHRATQDVMQQLYAERFDSLEVQLDRITSLLTNGLSSDVKWLKAQEMERQEARKSRNGTIKSVVLPIVTEGIKVMLTAAITYAGVVWANLQGYIH